jgi:hypothetical protein
MFGMSREQSAKAARVLMIFATEWRDLVAGREGFLVDKKRAGLIGQQVVWGEMDAMVCLHYYFFPRFTSFTSNGILG